MNAKVKCVVNVSLMIMIGIIIILVDYKTFNKCLPVYKENYTEEKTNNKNDNTEFDGTETDSTQNIDEETSNEAESENLDNIEQQTIKTFDELTQEEKLTYAHNIMSGIFQNENEYFSIVMPDASADGFVTWLQNCMGVENFISMSLQAEQNEFPESILYSYTGKSVKVLLDEYTGNIASGNIRQISARDSAFANLVFAGDICLTEDGFAVDHYDETGILSDYIDKRIIDTTNYADIFMLNNEFSMSEKGEPISGKLYTFRANPLRAGILKEMGTDIVSLANNHVYDYGIEAFEDTLNILDANDIAHVGAGENINEAASPYYYVINGIKIGIVSACMAERVRYTPGAEENRAGIFLMYDDTRLKEVIKNTKNQCDYVIAFLHWGNEDSQYYTEKQHNISAELISMGADAIIGGHPHVLQGIEYIDNKPVIYSLGDFWFNGETKNTAIINMKITIDGLSEMKIIPCIQSGYKTMLVDNQNEKDSLFSYLAGLSNNISISPEGIVSK